MLHLPTLRNCNLEILFISIYVKRSRSNTNDYLIRYLNTYFLHDQTPYYHWIQNASQTLRQTQTINTRFLIEHVPTHLLELS